MNPAEKADDSQHSLSLRGDLCSSSCPIVSRVKEWAVWVFGALREGQRLAAPAACTEQGTPNEVGAHRRLPAWVRELDSRWRASIVMAHDAAWVPPQHAKQFWQTNVPHERRMHWSRRT